VPPTFPIGATHLLLTFDSTPIGATHLLGFHRLLRLEGGRAEELRGVCMAGTAMPSLLALNRCHLALQLALNRCHPPFADF
ncbi:MAG: hypothetical protein ACK56Q_07115, partial [Pirellulaceae bacterium]